MVLERKCGQTVPTPFQGMDITWPYKRRELGIDTQHMPILLILLYICDLSGDEIVYTCPNNHETWSERHTG